MKKIAFIYDVPYPWHVGGIESMNYNEAEELAKVNDVHYFTTKWPGMKSSEFTKDNIKYHAYGDTDQKKIYVHGRRSVLQAEKFKYSLSRLFKYKFDFVITNQFPILHLPMVKFYCYLTKSKLIMEVAEAWNEGYWKSYLGSVPGFFAFRYQQLFTKGADFYITISSKTTSELIALGIPKEKIKEFSPAVDDDKIRSIKKSKKSKKTVIFSGRLIKEKRVDKWIVLFAKALKKDPSLSGLIIGKGPEKVALEEKIKRMGLSEKIKIRDFFDDSTDFYKVIKDSSLMLNLSEREGLGIIAIEGIALGTPVLLPKSTPLPKEVKEMCVVADEKQIPSLIVEIANSKDRSKYIKNDKNLKMFYKSQVNDFYSKLFSQIGSGNK